MRHLVSDYASMLRDRLSEQKIYLDATTEIDGNLSVIESHYITEEIFLAHNYQVHVEPYFDL